MTTAESKTDQLTVRRALEKHYLSDEQGKGTKSLMRTAAKNWEKFTGNPPIQEVTNSTVAEFRQAMIDSGKSPSYINTTWRQIRSVLRRVGPVTDGNPWALDLFPSWRVPAMRPVQEPFKRPLRLAMENIDRLYLASRHMKRPVRNVPNSAFWWQALIVTAYFTGLRVSDLLKIKWSDINEQEETLFVKTQKTGMEADLPLHPSVIGHLSRLERRTKRVFHCDKRLFYRFMKELKTYAELDGFDGFHDIRRTAASEAERVRSGMGKALLLHAPSGVTEQYYLNLLPDLRDVVAKMREPDSFRHGPKMTQRALKEATKVVTLRPNDFTVPVHPPIELFGFTKSGFTFGGHFIPATMNRLKILKTLVMNGGVCTQRELWRVVMNTPFPKGGGHQGRLKLWRQVSYCRDFLRRNLKLPEGYNPICATCLDHPYEGCNYELFLPPALWVNPELKGGAT
ncbi:MAG TPA: site-specific integrase [Planctomicrobium sp.]|nr:site-specific integrase [Planctomicrobium sp.]